MLGLVLTRKIKFSTVRDNRQSPFVLDLLTRCLTVVGLVGGHDERRSRRIQDVFDDLAVVDLPTSDAEVQGSTLAIDDRMDFRGARTTADANRLIFLPLLRRWPRDALSQSCYRSSSTNCCAILPPKHRKYASRLLTQDQRLNRLYALVAFGQIAPRDPGPQHVNIVYDPSIVRARALPTLRHERLENRPFLIAEIESHDPPPPAVTHDPCCFSVNYAGTDPSMVQGSCRRRRTIAEPAMPV
jgi:hypothetical protein